MDEGGHDLAALLPELADLPSRVMARSAVIDGELVVVDAAGRADPGGLAARLRGEKARRFRISCSTCSCSTGSSSSASPWPAGGSRSNRR